ncbi:MAG: hypothetical protein VX294_03155 [Candidatus Latescibacterota bacterium]|nr:hypothetical protein [Candidatus Latescibacterota bacterium]
MRAVIGLIGFTTLFLGSLYWWVSADSPLRISSIIDEELSLFPSDAIATTFIFVADDCPISNRYSPEIQRLAKLYTSLGINFHLVYVKPDITQKEIEKHTERFFSNISSVLHDPYHDLVHLSEASVTPQAAIFDNKQNLVYSGRINDRYIDFGKQRPKAQKADLEDALRSLLSNKFPNPKRTTAVGCYIRDLRR